MRFYGRSPEQAVQETIRDYRQAAGYIKPLRDTLDKYAGKVYNRRFLDALRAAAGYDRIYDDRRAEMVYIYIYTANNYDPHTICRITLDDKRIDATESKKSAVSYYTKHLQDAAKIEEYAPQVDIFKQRIAHLEKMISSIKGALPFELRDIYGIH